MATFDLVCVFGFWVGVWLFFFAASAANVAFSISDGIGWRLAGLVSVIHFAVSGRKGKARALMQQMPGLPTVPCNSGTRVVVKVGAGSREIDCHGNSVALEIRGGANAAPMQDSRRVDSPGRYDHLGGCCYVPQVTVTQRLHLNQGRS